MRHNAIITVPTIGLSKFPLIRTQILKMNLLYPFPII